MNHQLIFGNFSLQTIEFDYSRSLQKLEHHGLSKLWAEIQWKQRTICNREESSRSEEWLGFTSKAFGFEIHSRHPGFSKTRQHNRENKVSGKYEPIVVRSHIRRRVYQGTRAQHNHQNDWRWKVYRRNAQIFVAIFRWANGSWHCIIRHPSTCFHHAKYTFHQ